MKTSYIACLPIMGAFAAPVKYVLVKKDGLIARGQDADNLALTNVLAYDDKT
jgi:predicted transglutaminase-like cysteine proteinase